jgi:hypothetical protein
MTVLASLGLSIACAPAIGDASATAIVRTSSQQGFIKLCYPSSASKGHKAAQVRVVRDRVRSYGIQTHWALSRSGACGELRIGKPVSLLDKLAQDVSQQGLLALTADVPHSSSSSGSLPPGSAVRYASDRVTRRNRKLPVVKVVIPDSDLLPGSATVSHTSNGAPIVDYSLDPKAGRAWCPSRRATLMTTRRSYSTGGS